MPSLSVTVIKFKLKTSLLERQMMKVLTIPRETTPFKIIKRMSQTFQRMTVWMELLVSFKYLHPETKAHQPKVEKRTSLTLGIQ